jgi:precorrin-2 dehydrogenase/sirohydrochlorin ferrochelatase
MGQFPINLNLAGRPVLVVGGGRIALRKVQQLLLADADVTVLSPSIVDELRALPVAKIEREYRIGDVSGYRLVITATGVRGVDQQIYDDCEIRNIWVNSADDPERCAFTLPATMRRGELMVTVSTAGASPALASFLRSRLESAIGPEFAALVDRLATERAAVHAEGRSTEDIDWAPVIARAIDELGIDSALLSVEVAR